MTSNFVFLQENWPDLYEIGNAAEGYLYADPNACVFKIGLLAERLVQIVLAYEELESPQEATHLDRIRILRKEGLLPQNVDDILFAIRKARNNAVHFGGSEQSTAAVLLRMCHSLCGWFTEVYGSPETEIPAYSEPEDLSRDQFYAQKLAEQEERIKALTEQLDAITRSMPRLSAGERTQRSEEASGKLALPEEVKEYLKESSIRIDCTLMPVLNYALQQNRLPVIQQLSIVNRSDEPLEDIELQLSSTPDLCIPLKKHIDYIPANSTYNVKELRLMLNGEFLAGLTEKLTGLLHLSIRKDDRELYSDALEMTALAFDEWHGNAYLPELLAAFVTPNHPEVTRIVAEAAVLLGQWTGSPSLNAYQSNDPSRVLMQAAAIYGVLQKKNIVYAVAPASFERVGQRIRLCDAVLNQRMGTCMDLSLLYASCLEAIGLHPILVLQPGHIFTAFWLEDLSFPEAIQDDATALTKRLANGVNEIAVVETTCMVAGKSVSFDDARQLAEQELIGQNPIEHMLDVARARLSGISPLPNRIHTDDGWRVELPAPDPGKVAAAPRQFGETIDVDVDRKDAFSKRVQWERKLLDLGLRNALINMRMTRSIVPVLTPSLDLLEDGLVEGTEFAVLPRPTDWQSDGTKLTFDNLHDLNKNEELIQHEFQNKRLRTTYTESELKQIVKNLYRTAKSSLEENGANTLYLALGLLRWYESDHSRKARYAPLILIPVDLVRKLATHSYVIRLRDDEPQINITVLEMLKQEFNIVVNGLETLPQDGLGVDIRKVLTTIRKAVMGQHRWDVLESAYLGIFSFSQFVLWNDIHSRCDALAQNKIVRSLMDGKLAWDATDMTIGDRVPEDHVYLPLPADASQLYAIEAASKGESFVLHGPPGTGKSQTITALIANALGQGKTVLFVAEKMAALEVVEKRLAAIGLGEFCLELHSNKAKKRAVLEQLRLATEVTRHRSPAAFAQKADQLATLRRELDDYASAMHSPTACGLSLFDLINEYEANQQADDLPPFSIDTLTSVNLELLERHRTALERMVAAGRETGHPHQHIFSPVMAKQYSQQLRLTLPGLVQAYQLALENHRQCAEKHALSLSWPDASTLEEHRRAAATAVELLKWQNAPRSWAKTENINRCLTDVQTMARHFLKAAELRDELLNVWMPAFLKEDGERLLMEYNQNANKWFLPKLFGMSGLTRKLSGYCKTQLSPDRLAQDLTALADYQAELANGKELLALYVNNLEHLYAGEETNWAAVEQLAGTLRDSSAALLELTRSDDMRMQYAADRSLTPVLTEMLDSWTKLLNTQKDLYAALLIMGYTGSEWIDNQVTLCDALLKHQDQLRSWIHLNAAAQEASSLGLETVVACYRNGLPHDQVLPAYRKSMYQSLGSHYIDKCPVLANFSGAVFNEKIQQLKRMDQEMMQLTRQEIYCRLAAKVPSFTKEAAQSSELGILQRAIRSNGRGISIRKLFEQIPNLLPRLCPCMLMSPISAAQYLEPGRELFDLVVFDEASQLPTCKAVGALARGRDAVIVGDPNQMPPTSFFTANTIDEEHLEQEDLESILDDCLALNMPQTHLLWHYRSRHESLIAFSNSQFYQNKLFTFPSVNDRESKVRIVYVEGVFERGHQRQNTAEAEAVVNDLIRRCHDEELRKLSVGVVTFNIMQQNLIDDLLLEAYRNDPELEQWALEREEPLFVKNLENVQGDERDVILFSIGYGPDEKGKVYMNFGPLNRDGGWRRLNVAVSRARHEMVVFSSLRPEQIDLNKTSAAGVAALKAFLEYAAGHELSQDENTVSSDRDRSQGIAASISNALREQGYQTQLNVGHSEYRIDVGVIDPDDKEHYLLGILLDGDGYHSSKTTRDREIAQISVLNGLGWKIHRVWSMDWWENSQKELERILALLDAIRQGDTAAEEPVEANTAEEREPAEEASVQEASEASETAAETCEAAPQNESAGFYAPDETADEPVSSEYRHYTYAPTVLTPEPMSSEMFLQSSSNYSIVLKTTEVLSFEAPVSESVLMRRVLQSYGITRIGARIQAKMKQILASMGLTTTTQNSETFYWDLHQSPDLYPYYRISGSDENKRDVKDVPVQEAANAICQVLLDQFSLSEEDLIRESAKLMGYSRTTANVIAVFSEAIRYAADQERIQMSGPDRWIIKESVLETSAQADPAS